VHRGPAERELADREPRDGAPQVRAPQDRAPLDPLGVQHHHAHLVACLAEHGETGPALGVIFDGTGYGPDGTVWGGEFLLGDLTGYERVAHLHQVRLPGGEAAIREPWRIACAWLVAAGEEEATTSGTHQGSLTHPVLPTTLAGAVDPARWAAVARLARSGVAAPLTSSMGRLFDAVAALCGLGAVASYEGEAAIALEAAIDPEEPEWYEIPVVAGGSPAGMSVSGPSTAMSTAAPTISGSEASIRDVAPLTLDARPLIRAVVAELAAGTPVKTIAARFHNALARATTQLCTRLAERHGTHLVVLSGGVFQNRALHERSAAELARAGLQVLTAERIPPNDGGIAYGQAAIAAARSHAESSNSQFFTADGAPKLRPGGA
jgi:hydrogenase maturation protein HypF